MATPPFVRWQTDVVQYRVILAIAFLAYLPVVIWRRVKLAILRDVRPPSTLLAETFNVSATTARLALAG